MTYFEETHPAWILPIPPPSTQTPMAQKRKDPWPGSLVYRKNRIYIKFGNRLVEGISFPRTADGEKLAQLAKKNIYLQKMKNISERTTGMDTTTPAIPQRNRRDKYIQKLFRAFLEAKRTQSRPLSEETLRGYELAFRRIVTTDYPIDAIAIAPQLGSRKADEMYQIEQEIICFVQQPHSIRKGKNGKQVRPISPSSTNIYLRGLQVFLNWCTREHYLPMKLELYTKYRRASKTKDVVICEDKDFAKLIEDFHERDHDFKNFLLLLRYMGGRAKETIELQKKQFNLREGLITLPNKRDKSEADYFPITKTIAAVYHEQCAQYPHNKLLFPRWTKDSLSHLAKKLQRAQKRAGITTQAGSGFHIFRKTFTDSLFDKNLTLDEIKDAARHKSITTTLTHYRRHRAKNLGKHLEE